MISVLFKLKLAQHFLYIFNSEMGFFYTAYQFAFVYSLISWMLLLLLFKEFKISFVINDQEVI